MANKIGSLNLNINLYISDVPIPFFLFFSDADSYANADSFWNSF